MNPHQSQPPPTWAIVLAFVALYISWGTTYLAIKKGVRDEQLPPCLFAGVRVFLAGCILLAFMAYRKSDIQLTRGDFFKVLITGSLFFVGGNGLLNLAEKKVDSGVAAILAATTPMWMALLETMHPRGARLRFPGWFGLAVGLLGVVLLIAPGADLASLSADFGGAGLVLLCALCWAVGAIYWRLNPVHLSPFVTGAYQMMFGGGILTIIGLAVGEVADLPEQITTGALFSFFYLLVVASFIGYLSFHYLLHHVSSAQVGTHAYVNPIIAVILGWIWDQETLTLWALGGVVLVLLGVALVREKGRSGSAKSPAMKVSDEDSRVVTNSHSLEKGNDGMTS